MKFLLIGAGAVGCWIGANLMRAGHDVTFVGRSKFVDAVRSDGLRVKLPDGNEWQLQNIAAAISVSAAMHAAPFDAVIACMKAYAVADALTELRPHADALQSATFIPFQNGVGSDDLFADAFGAERVVAATLTSPVSLEAPNVVRLERARGGVGLAPLRPLSPWGIAARTGWRGWVRGNLGSPLTSDVTHVFTSASLLHTRLYADARSLRWSKLLLNIVGNATSAILDKTVAEIYMDPLWSQAELRMLRECVCVIDAQRIKVVNLPGAPAAWLARAIRALPDALLRPVMLRAFAKARGDKRPSFYYDVAQRTGRSEVSWLNGAIADAGTRLGVPTPVNATLTEVLSELVKPDATITVEESQRWLVKVIATTSVDAAPSHPTSSAPSGRDAPTGER